MHDHVWRIKKVLLENSSTMTFSIKKVVSKFCSILKWSSSKMFCLISSMLLRIEQTFVTLRPWFSHTHNGLFTNAPGSSFSELSWTSYFFNVPSRLRGSILRPTSTVYPTRSKTVQNGSEYFFSRSLSINCPKWPFQTVFKQKNPEENKQLYQTSYEPCLSTIPQAIKAFLMHFSVIFSSWKLGFLKSSENLAAFSHFWPLFLAY